MADPNNPFDVNQLNGLDISSGALGHGTEVPTNQIGTIELKYLAGSTFSAPASIHVTDDHYVAAKAPQHIPGPPDYPQYDYMRYYLPTFGKIDIVYDNGVVQGHYYIYGFTENGLLLSSYDNSFQQSNAANPGVFVWKNPGYTFALSRYPFNTTYGLPSDTTFTQDGSTFCFAEGTRVETVNGPVAVEALAVGDLLVTASGEPRPLTWIGSMVSRPARHREPWTVNPVTVMPHAFGPGAPRRAVRLSPGHAVFVEGVLVPAGLLVNGATIVQEPVERVRYFHLELAAHEVLVAEGLPCESYLNDGNRSAFNWGGLRALDARPDGRPGAKSWDDACAPMVDDGPQLAAIRARLDAQARALGWVRSEAPDLVVAADGGTIRPVALGDGRLRFDIPAAGEIVLRSRHGIAAELMPGLPDRRTLGVALAALWIDGAPVALDDARLGAGFHPVETRDGQSWRWTDGAASLALAGGAPATVEVCVLMALPNWIPAETELRAAA